MLDQKNWITIAILLIIIVIVIFAIKYFRSKQKEANKGDLDFDMSNNLLAGLISGGTGLIFDSNNPEEGEKMTSPKLLKNTIMSKVPIEKITSNVTSNIYPKYIREGLFYIVRAGSTIDNASALGGFIHKDNDTISSTKLQIGNTNLSVDRNAFAQNAFTTFSNNDNIKNKFSALPILLNFASSNNNEFSFYMKDIRRGLSQQRNIYSSYDDNFSGWTMKIGTTDADDTSSLYTFVRASSGGWYIKNNGQFLSAPGGSDINNTFTPVFNTNQSFMGFVFELVPVLDEQLADRYLNASVDYMNKNWSTDVIRQPKLMGFCGDNIRFPDGTLKIDIGDSTKISADKVTAAFERICACNMNSTIKPTFYTRTLCSDEFIKNTYGINYSPNTLSNGLTLYDNIRENLNCNKPKCIFQKCKNLNNPENSSSLNTTLVGLDQCASTTLCIINQNLNNNGAMEGNTINQSAENKCGQVGTDGVFPDENNNLSWLPNNTLLNNN